MREYLQSDDLAEGFREAAEAAVDLVRGIPERRPVSPGPVDAETQAFFDGALGDEGIGLQAAVKEFRERIADRSMATPHPLYLGLVNSSPLPGGMIGDLFISLYNNNGGAAEQSPPATAAERAVIRRLCDGLGMNGGGGMLVPGGAFSILTALHAARDRAFPEWQKKGPAAAPLRPTMYTSEQGHFSLQRCARALGAGDESVRSAPIVGRGAMDAAALDALIAADKEEGRTPFCIVATAGTTSTGAYDPLHEVADVAERHGLWFHVDAAYGGAVFLSDRHRHLLDGVERADSVTIDPHKWLFIPMTAGAILVKDTSTLLHAFDLRPSYIPIPEGPADAFRIGLPCSRRSSGLKVWLAWRAHGLRVIREAVDRNIELTREIERRLAAEGFDVYPDGAVSIALAREPSHGAGGEASDAWQERIARGVVESGEAWFATVRHEGKTWLRFNMVNLYTTAEDVDRLIAAVLRCREEISS